MSLKKDAAIKTPLSSAVQTYVTYIGNIKMKNNPLPDDLPADLRAYLESVPPVSAEMTERVAAANRALENDPAFQADFIKALFVEKMYAALDERNETKSTLADRLGKSRQYIQKLFNEDNCVNFTIETLCTVAHALGRRIHMHVYRENEQPVIVSRPRTPILIRADGWDRPPALASRLSPVDRFIRTNMPAAPVKKEAPVEYPIAA